MKEVSERTSQDHIEEAAVRVIKDTLLPKIEELRDAYHAMYKLAEVRNGEEITPELHAAYQKVERHQEIINSGMNALEKELEKYKIAQEVKGEIVGAGAALISGFIKSAQDPSYNEDLTRNNAYIRKYSIEPVFYRKESPVWKKGNSIH